MYANLLTSVSAMNYKETARLQSKHVYQRAPTGDQSAGNICISLSYPSWQLLIALERLVKIFLGSLKLAECC